MHIHIYHTLNKVTQSYKWSSTKNRGKKNKFLNQSRLSYGPSLRRKRPFAQATSPRLGETITESPVGFASSRLAEPSSPKRDHSLPKGEVPRLSYNQAKHSQALTNSCLGEPLSPKRDDTSLKTKALCLSEGSSRNLGQLLLFSPRRDQLACARISVLATISRIQARFNRRSTHHTFLTPSTTPYKHLSTQNSPMSGKIA